MLADRNDLPKPIGRGEGKRGGYPAGAISEETFSWWKKKIKENYSGFTCHATRQ